MPAKALPLLLAAEENAYRISLNPCGSGISDAGPARHRSSPRSPCRSAPTIGVVSMKMDAIFISRASIFLPRYSGVRPIISPAMNTPRIAKISIVYIPVPTPPGATSPSWIRNNGTNPPIGIMESCMLFTAPLEVPVVAEAKRAEAAMPKRASLPSMLPPACSGARGLIDALKRRQGVAMLLADEKPESRAARAKSASQPGCPTLAAVPDHDAERIGERRTGITKSPASPASSSTASGFSKGCAEFALKKPPPLVPSSLMASCDATGPMGRVWVWVVTDSVTGLPADP